MSSPSTPTSTRIQTGMVSPEFAVTPPPLPSWSSGPSDERAGDPRGDYLESTSSSPVRIPSYSGSHSSSVISQSLSDIPATVLTDSDQDRDLEAAFENVNIESNEDQIPTWHVDKTHGGSDDGTINLNKKKNRMSWGSSLKSPKLGDGGFGIGVGDGGGHDRTRSLSPAGFLQATAKTHRKTGSSSSLTAASFGGRQSSSTYATKDVSTEQHDNGYESTKTTASTSAPIDGQDNPTTSSATNSKPTATLTSNGFHAPSSGSGAANKKLSMLDKVMSKTRPRHLPPKNKEEDQKHSRDWEKMMKESLLAEKQKQQALLHQQELHAQHAASLIPIWETNILPSPQQATMKDPKLRAVWWEGVPASFREQVWEKCIGNGLGISASSYTTHVQRFIISMEKQAFPTRILQQLEQDASEAYPGLTVFKPNEGTMYPKLREFLGAWVVARSDEGLPYVSGVHLIAATFLLVMTPEIAWKSLLNLLASSSCLRALLDPGRADEKEAYYRVLNTLNADALPRIYYNLMSNEIKIPSTWFQTLFVEQLSFDVVCRVWDQFVLEGDSFLFKTCIAIIRTLEHRLYDPDPSELRAVLSGQSVVLPPPTLPVHPSGTRNILRLPIASNPGQTSKTDGSGRGKVAIQVNRLDSLITGGGKKYGIEEDRLFGMLLEGEADWKDNSFQRLIQRELDSAM
ncbi:Uncharacterized conserved protein, contains TBC domain [Phaffia rhodozyma]|uniref:Uncharacterized conserved protein, contains TBC domain n=1 Tax=Phaffia rhodozyma TaxID=264483 RepID=A0A0F7SVU8_PHARH|nr:Uncharacterized conserved protein, contains TBC domain [Phaffia rhodozyma]